MSDLGDRLYALRLAHQERQKDLAALLHVSAGTISNYETGLHLPTVDMLCQLAEHYGVSIDYLSGRTPCQISTDALNHAFTPEQSYGELIQQLEQLPQEKRSLLSSLIDDIYLSCYLRRQAAEPQSALSDSIS